VGVTQVAHAGGIGESKTYLVNLFLPNKVALAGVLVSECEDIVGDFGVIIGMDVITSGDFAITNTDDKTWVSFRVPSMGRIDYVEEFNRSHGQKAAVALPPFPDREPDPPAANL
jgi:hypothetical protein